MSDNDWEEVNLSVCGTSMWRRAPQVRARACNKHGSLLGSVARHHVRSILLTPASLTMHRTSSPVPPRVEGGVEDWKRAMRHVFHLLRASRSIAPLEDHDPDRQLAGLAPCAQEDLYLLLGGIRLELQQWLMIALLLWQHVVPQARREPSACLGCLFSTA